jgi:hypothetical protein
MWGRDLDAENLRLSACLADGELEKAALRERISRLPVARCWCTS